MRITFYSNFLNHHQLQFCMAMSELLEGKFIFVASQPIEEEQLKLGYEDMNSKYPFVLKTYTSEENHMKAKELAEDSDIIIFGSASIEYLKIRNKTGKPCFIYSERLFKPGLNRYMIRTYLAFLKRYMFLKSKNIYVLCASNYTSNDFRKIGAYTGKYYKWGYFPPNYSYEIKELMQRKENKLTPVILWVGRFIPLKHAETAILTANALAKKNIDFEMRMIGDGPLRQEIESMIEVYGLKEKIHILGSMSPQNVRKNMEEADVFLFNSDYNEGWGAVVNESMNSGCAVVVSHAIGSAGFLIKNGFNGIIYPFGEQDEVDYWTELLIRNKQFRENLGENAYRTIHDTWNARQGAIRFLKLCDNILNYQNSSPFETGPCSAALCCSNNRFGNDVRKELMRMKEYEGIDSTINSLYRN